MLNDSDVLPSLREDLRLEEAPLTDTGKRRWRLYDPVLHRCFLLEEADISLLTLWQSGTVGALKQSLQRMNLAFDDGQLEGLMAFLKRYQLFQLHSPEDYSEQQTKYLQGGQVSNGWQHWLDKVRSYRRPIFLMQPLLKQIDPVVRLVGHKIFLFIWLVITTFGLYFSFRQWDEFINTASGLLNVEGMIAFGLTLFVLKCFHELGHAYLAHYFGCKVGRIGIATFLFFPMLYTELDDVSRLDSARQRMLIGAGGILTEIMIAGIATFFWAVLSDGLLRSLAFMVATTCWTTSLLINLNPFAKFDGYYILSDFLQVENLQSKAMSWGRWFLDRLVIGPSVDVPDQAKGRVAFALVGFGIATWFYQIILLTSVSYLMYSLLLPALGVCLFVAVVMTYVVAPMIKKLNEWWQKRQLLSWLRKGVLVSLLFGGGCLMFFPLDQSVSLPSVVRHSQIAVVRAPENAYIENWYFDVNSAVEEGALIARFHSPDLEKKIQEAKISYNLAQQRLNRVVGEARQREFALVLVQEYEKSKATLEALLEQEKRLQWRAPASGRLVDVPLQLQAGQWVAPSQSLGRIVARDQQEGVAFVNEKQMQRLTSGAKAYFYPDDPSWSKKDAKIEAITPSAIDALQIVELDKAYGGDIATEKDDQGIASPIQALHQVRFTFETGEITRDLQLSGKVVIEASPQSVASQAWANVWTLILTELRR